jgi:hypothetical protein
MMAVTFQLCQERSIAGDLSLVKGLGRSILKKRIMLLLQDSATLGGFGEIAQL